MSSMSEASTAGLLAIVLAVGACGGGGGDSSIAGTYQCSLEGAGAQRTIDIFEFREDGTVSQDIEALGKTVEGTWSQEGDSVKIESEAGDLTFTLEGDRLVDPDGFTCTPKS
jgi:hypothetical protein